jgi:succinate dehydrogenase/fumarate reductase flavoprotein subunit
MAGLVAAARARELGASPVVFEKGNRPGGSMLLSSGVVWRHRSTEDFRRECPGGDPALQRRIVDELDNALDWLESIGASPVAIATGNPRTVGRRYDPRALTEVLVRAAGDVRLEASFEQAEVLATGGFGARLARERGLLFAWNREA